MSSQPIARSRHLLAGVAVVADVTAVVTLFALDSLTLITVTAALLLLTGAYLLVRGWNENFGRRLLIGIAGTVVGASTLTAVLVPKITASGEPSAATPSISAASTPTASTKPAGEPAIEVKLEESRGIDLETDRPTVVTTDGANGAVDLFLAAGIAVPELHANNSDFAFVDTNEKEARNRCTALMDQLYDTINGVTVLYADAVSPGDQFCFYTSQREVAWARVNDTNGRRIVLNVKLWR